MCVTSVCWALTQPEFLPLAQRLWCSSILQAFLPLPRNSKTVGTKPALHSKDSACCCLPFWWFPSCLVTAVCLKRKGVTNSAPKKSLSGVHFSACQKTLKTTPSVVVCSNPLYAVAKIFIVVCTRSVYARKSGYSCANNVTQVGGWLS